MPAGAANSGITEREPVKAQTMENGMDFCFMLQSLHCSTQMFSSYQWNFNHITYKSHVSCMLLFIYKVHFHLVRFCCYWSTTFSTWNFIFYAQLKISIKQIDGKALSMNMIRTLSLTHAEKKVSKCCCGWPLTFPPGGKSSWWNRSFRCLIIDVDVQ